MGLGRIGNFIDGQIVGSVTHPALGRAFSRRGAAPPSGGAVRRGEEPAAGPVSPARPADQSDAGRGRGALRLLVRGAADRDRPVSGLPHAPARAGHRADPEPRDGDSGGRPPRPLAPASSGRLPARAAVPIEPDHRPATSFNRTAAGLSRLFCAFCLVIPSNWTQDIPARYGRRHPGLYHWWLYPPLATAPMRNVPVRPTS